MSNATLDYPFSHSNFHIPKPNDEIKRTHVIKDLKYRIEKNTRNVFITGESGIGKSVFLSQLALDYGNDAIALFLDPISLISRSEQTIKMDISEQIYWLVYQKSDDISDGNIDHYPKACTALARHCNHKKNNKVIFIIDGLDNIEDTSSIEMILNLIPFHITNIAFVISTDHQFIYDKFLIRKEPITYFPIPLMTEFECKELFKDISESDVLDILRTYDATPEKLTSIKRILDKGFTTKELLESYGDHNESILETEYRLNSDNIDKHYQIFSIIAFSPVFITLNELSECLKISNINIILSSISFIKIDGCEVKVASEAFKSYLKVKLAKHHFSSTSILESIIETRERTAENILTIIKYKFSEEDYTGVINELTNDSIVSVYKKESSLNTIGRILQIAIKSSEENKYINDKIKFCHLSSLVKGVSEISVLKSELECYLSQNDYGAANVLANQAVLIEDKIQLLSIIATYQKNENIVIDENVISQIKYLYSKLDLSHIEPSVAMDISISIFPIFPEYSFRIIAMLDKIGKSGGNKSDYAYARLYFEAVLKNTDDLDNINVDEFNLEEKFKDSIKRVQQFKGGASLDNLINEIKTLDIIDGDRIGLIAEAVKTFPKYKSIQSLINYGLDLIIETPDYSANCTIYKDLSSSLDSNFDEKLSNANYKKIEAQLSRLQKLGPTIDYVSLCLNIAKYEQVHLNQFNRHKSIFEFVKDDIPDRLVSLRATMCIQSVWHITDYKSYWGDLTKYKNETFDEILTESAQHYQILKDVIEEEAIINFGHSLQWCEKLNTLSRVNKAKSKAIISHISNTDKINIASICTTINKITDDNSFTKALFATIQKVLQSDSISDSEFQRIKKLKNNLANNTYKAKFIAYLICLLDKLHSNSKLIKENLIDELLESFEKIDADWNKVDIGFQLINIINEYDPKLALRIRKKVIDIRENSDIDAVEIKNSYVRSLDLAIKINNTFLKASSLRTDNIDAIISRINLLSGNIEKSKLFAKLISSLQVNSYISTAKNIIETNIIGMLDGYGKSYTKEFGIVLYCLSPVLYTYDKETFKHYVSLTSDSGIVNNAISSCISHIFEKIMLFEPFYHTDKHSYKLSYIDVKNIFSLLVDLTEDWLIYSNLKRLTFALKGLCKNNSFSSVQKSEIDNLYLSIIDMFPIVGGISHNGYSICCKALRLNYNNEKKTTTWLSLFVEAKKIKNIADYIFTSTCILESAPLLNRDEKQRILKEIITDVSLVNIAIERIDLIENIYSSCKDICRKTVKDALNNALLLTMEEDSVEYQRKRMILIDACFELDSRLPSSLASLMDDDPHRKQIIEKNISDKKIKDELKDSFNESGSSKLKRSEELDFANYCNDQLGKFHANKTAKRKSGDLFKYLKNTTDFNAQNFHIVLSYFLQAYGDNFRNEQQLDKNIQPLFDSIISNSTVFCEIYRIKGSFNISTVKNEGNIALGIGPNEINRASDFIRDWFTDDNRFNLLISEPYFSMSDLNFIISSLDRDFSKSIKILTSLKVYYRLIQAMKENGGYDDLDDYIEQYWLDNICPDSNPRIEFIFAGCKSDESPLIHDRWWLSADGKKGITIGTSINGIGSKYSAINIMSPSDSSEIFSICSNIIEKNIMEHKGERVIYKSSMLI